MTRITFNVITNMCVINSLVPCRSPSLLCFFTFLYFCLSGHKKMRHRGSRNSASNRSNSSEGQSGGAGLSKAALQGLQSECAGVWFDRVVYERAETMYHIRLLERQNGSMAPARNQDNRHHRNQEANKPNFDQAEGHFAERSTNQAVAPRSLQLQPSGHPSQPPCDEGYQSQTPTPPTPASRPINGLPCLSASLMGVWLQKPLYDKAETSYYQNLYASNIPPPNPQNNNNKRSNSKRRSGAVAKKAKSVVNEQQKCDDVARKSGRAQFNFLHADSERVWLDRGCYAEAETRFYEGAAARTVKTPRNNSSQSRKKYDSRQTPHTFPTHL